MGSDHQRNVGPMMTSLRCGAQTRSGGKCQAPAVAGKARCRMHGGAKGSGAAKGNRNALKHGAFAADFLDQMRQARDLVAEARAHLKKL